jgi:hypothetical protein
VTQELERFFAKCNVGEIRFFNGEVLSSHECRQGLARLIDLVLVSSHNLK